MLSRLSRFPWAAGLSGLATGVALLLAVIVLLNLSTVATRNCRKIELVKGRLRTVVAASAKTLGQPGSAGFSYYAAHPAELAQAQRDARRALHNFRATPC